MKRIATIQERGRIVGLVHGPDACDQQITVNGRVWRFDHDERLGPLWLRKDGMERKCQCPGKAVWNEWENWHRRWRRKKKKQLPNSGMSDSQSQYPVGSAPPKTEESQSAS